MQNIAAFFTITTKNLLLNMLFFRLYKRIIFFKILEYINMVYWYEIAFIVFKTVFLRTIFENYR